MYFILLALASVLVAQDEVHVYALGTSYHGTWDEEGRPNAINVGSGIAYAKDTSNPGDAIDTFVTAGGLAYLDSYSKLGTVVMVGLNLRKTIGAYVPEAGVSMCWWRGSGNDGKSPVPFYYVGMGYRLSTGTLFVEGSYDPSQQLTMGWLKFAVPVN